ncbi:hypothetical protein PR202_ga21698 [Eleusine coracana subsp. coracana]|uniref:Molybdenum cofactor sulfurase n=1 Tax=Eleusine coracana subsp. coracana TaxID=191504 RepID=A0AAV5D1N2_ELECO|nr:hypothetical protein PR202_ga21698 [Eleusine coracana subsp. coracana]
MLVLINKYIRSSKDEDRAGGGSRKGGNQQPGMPPGSSNNDHHNMCIPGCVPVRAAKRAATTTVTTTTTTARASRHNFVKAAASGLLAGAHFTNHESLPSLPDAYAEFAAAFPQYGAVARADAVRGAEYGHLDRHVCLDYTGINLFSHAQMNASLPSTSSSSSVPSAPAWWQPPFFDIAYKSTSLRTQVQQCGASGRGSAAAIGPAVTRRIMASLKIPEDEYTMVPTANRTTAFRLLAESYSFSSSSSGGGGVYDYESEAAAALSAVARRRGADVASATFAWPSMRIHAADLRKKLSKGRRRRSNKGYHRGLFVFPLASRMTGARYPYLWMSAAQERGWHVALDACASGSKDLDTLGVSLLRPDFIVCNFFKVFGENPSGFAGLFVKKSSLPALERSVVARSIGVVTIVPARRWSLLPSSTTYNDDGGYSTEFDHSQSFPKGDANEEFDDVDTSVSFSGPLSATVSRNLQPDPPVSDEIREVHDDDAVQNNGRSVEPEESAAAAAIEDETEEASPTPIVSVECRGLDHADALGLVGIGNRLRCVSNWLVVALQKLRHPSSSSSSSTTTDHHGHALVRVYGPRVKFERGPSLAFNVFDWKGERVAPPLVQKLADRHAIALTCGFLRNIWFADKYEADRALVLERRPVVPEHAAAAAVNKRKNAAGDDVGVFVVNASLGFLSNFDDAYRLWAFVAKFLDADFVEKERWRYTALNQRTVEV